MHRWRVGTVGDETNSARVIPGPRIGTLVNPQQRQDTRRASAQVCRRHSVNDVIVQNLGYRMRSALPDATDLQIATAFGALAIEALRRNERSSMCALVNGCFTSVDVSSPLKARKQVDVARDYNRENCRPRLSALAGRSTSGL